MKHETHLSRHNMRSPSWQGSRSPIGTSSRTWSAAHNLTYRGVTFGSLLMPNAGNLHDRQFTRCHGNCLSIFNYLINSAEVMENLQQMRMIHSQNQLNENKVDYKHHGSH